MGSARDIENVNNAAPAGQLERMADGNNFWRPSTQTPGSAKGRVFRDHWLDLCGDRAMPPRSALDPLEIRQLLPHIVLIDVMREPVRFRYRLIGTFVTGLAGRDATGRFLDRALYGRFLEAMIWPYQEVVNTGAPIATLSGVLFAKREWHCIENMFVPFGERGEIDVIAVCADVDQSTVLHDLTQGLVLDWRG